MKAVAALAAAVGLIVAAILIRDALDDDGDSAGGTSAGRGTTLVCPPELADACAELEDDVTVRVEAASVTADRLASAADADEAAVDVWLAPAPWAEVVGDARQRAGAPALVGEPSTAIGRSPVVLVMWDDRAAALEAGACGGPVEWRCLGDAADRPWDTVGGDSAWGRVNVGLTDPDAGTGLVVLGGAASGYFGSADYAANDLDGEFSGWLGALAAQSDAAAADVVNEMLTRGPGRFSAVGALEADALDAFDRDGVRVIYPAPVATADLVAIPIGGAEGAAGDIADNDDLRRVLGEAGWRVDGEPLVAGVDGGPDLPADDSLPSGGVLGALLARWNEVTG
jgi:Bacterial extracellular solute-binding protein